MAHRTIPGRAAVSCLLTALGWFCPAPGARAAAAHTRRPAASASKKPAPKRDGGRPRMFGGAEVFGAVHAVRGRVIQLSSPDSKGLTRVVLTPQAMIQKQVTGKLDLLKPGQEIMGAGNPPADEADSSTPDRLIVSTLMPAGGGPFGFFGGGGGPLWRGRSSERFRHNNYSGDWTFNGRVRTVDPLVLTDDDGNPLPVEMAPDLEVQTRVMQPIKEGDVAAGSFIVAIGSRAPDGLINAQMIIPLDQGSGGTQTYPGKITAMTRAGIQIHPRFMDQPLTISVGPATRVYRETDLDLGTLKEGDTVTVQGNVIAGTAAEPSRLIVHLIAPGADSIPEMPFGGGMGFMPTKTIQARLSGKLSSLDPPTLTTDGGRDVALVAPGQLACTRFDTASAAALHKGDRVVIAAKGKPGGGWTATMVVLDPSPLLGNGGP